MSTKIEWATDSWNPIRTIDGGYHCTKVSGGCQNCYAERFNHRFGNKKPFDNTKTEFVINEKQLEKPLHWKKPRKVFVQSMGDLFHENIPTWHIFEVLDIVRRAKQHTFLILTKRAEQMKEYMDWYYKKSGVDKNTISNLWLGVTCENQQRADERVPVLLQIPAAIRFVSVEPMLGSVDLNHLQPNREVEIDCLNGTHGVTRPHAGINEKLDWVICGGETSPGARPMRPDWVRSLRDQCQEAETPFFFKSWGDYCASSQMPDETYRAWDYHHGTESCWKTDEPIWKVGKKHAGRLLDGVEWNEYPEGAAL